MKRITYKQIYEKQIQDTFAGSGIETIIVQDNLIQAHIRAWDNPEVIDESWQGRLKGQPARHKGQGWQKLQGFNLENVQSWASEAINLKLGID